MFPVALNLLTLPILLIGEGEAFAKRRAQLEEAGAAFLTCRTHFNEYDLEGAKLVLVAGLSDAESNRIATLARAQKLLVNVEDRNELCDFYYMAQVRRGDLLLAVSTSGASPTLAKRVRDHLSELFDAKWAGYTDDIRHFRDGLRAQGKSMKEIMAASERFLEEKGWFKP